MQSDALCVKTTKDILGSSMVMARGIGFQNPLLDAMRKPCLSLMSLCMNKGMVALVLTLWTQHSLREHVAWLRARATRTDALCVSPTKDILGSSMLMAQGIGFQNRLVDAMRKRWWSLMSLCTHRGMVALVLTLWTHHSAQEHVIILRARPADVCDCTTIAVHCHV